MSDLAAIVQRAQAGDRDALAQAVEAVQDDVHRLALRMTGNAHDAADATQEVLVKVITRLSTFHGQAAFRTWVHRVAVNHLLDRKRSAVERYELSFGAFADDLASGLELHVAREPESDVLAREVKHGCTLALLACLDRDARVAYILGEVFEVSSEDGAWICETTEAAFRKRLSRARAEVRRFVAEHCGLVAPTTARCHCRRRVTTAVRLGRVDPGTLDRACAADVSAAVAEMERLHDAASLIRDVGDDSAPATVKARVRSVIQSGRFLLLEP